MVSLRHSTSGNSVNIKKSSPADRDSRVYNSLPTFIISLRSEDDLIEQVKSNNIAIKLIATHCFPAFEPKSKLFP